MIAAAVEELLLLAHQSQLGVVEQDDFNLDTFLGGRGEFLHVHEQAAVAAETSDGAAGAGDGRANGGRETEAHRAQAARSQPLARPRKRIGLRRPHLVLSDVGGDDGVFRQRAAAARIIP